MKIIVKKYRWKDVDFEWKDEFGNIIHKSTYKKGYNFGVLNYRGMNKEVVSTKLWLYKIHISIHWLM